MITPRLRDGPCRKETVETLTTETHDISNTGLEPIMRDMRGFKRIFGRVDQFVKLSQVAVTVSTDGESRPLSCDIHNPRLLR
jgi:hypothetical protein